MEEELKRELDKYKMFYEIVREENETMTGTYKSEKEFLQQYIKELETKLNSTRYRMIDKVCNIFKKRGE